MEADRSSLRSSFAAFAWPDFARLFAANALVTLGSRAMAVVLGLQVYRITGSKLALGMLGLFEAIPALSLALFGGHIADRSDRGAILRITLAALTVCGVALAVLEANDLGDWQLAVLFAVVFLAGLARGFAEPAASALEAQVIPWELLVHASTMMSTCWLISAVVGPLIGGVAFKIWGAPTTFAIIAVFYGLAFVAVLGITRRPTEQAPPGESIWQSISVGVKYVMRDQVLLGSMALDLFAVLFGGAIALLPVFAEDILQTDEVGLGMLNAAPMVGALITMLWAVYRPPVRHAGRNLFVSVALFGVVMIVFAFSRMLWLSLLMLFLSGVFDGVSVVIRRSILRLMSPEHLRGRIAAVSMVFIGSSNELGAFESGVAAELLTPERAVWIGGLVTLGVVAVVAIVAPKLRRLSLDPAAVARRDAQVDQQLQADEGAAP